MQKFSSPLEVNIWLRIDLSKSPIQPGNLRHLPQHRLSGKGLWSGALEEGLRIYMAADMNPGQLLGKILIRTGV